MTFFNVIHIPDLLRVFEKSYKYEEVTRSCILVYHGGFSVYSRGNLEICVYVRVSVCVCVSVTLPVPADLY